MAANELELSFGDVLQLQFLPDESNTRYYVKVIGYLPNQSLIVTTPHVHGKVMLVREGQRVAVRTMAGGNIIAFAGSVLRSCARPYPYLHLSYPKDLQTQALRRTQRVNFNLTAEVRDCTPGNKEASQSQTYVAKIEDMSTNGALLSVPQHIGQIKNMLSVRMNLVVAGKEERFATVAVIRNVRERKTPDEQIEFLYGVEFQIADRRDAILLHAFVYEHMVNG